MNLIDKQKAQLDDIYSGIQAAFLELSTDFVQPDWTDAELIRASSFTRHWSCCVV